MPASAGSTRPIASQIRSSKLRAGLTAGASSAAQQGTGRGRRGQAHRRSVRHRARDQRSRAARTQQSLRVRQERRRRTARTAARAAREALQEQRYNQGNQRKIVRRLIRSVGAKLFFYLPK